MKSKKESLMCRFIDQDLNPVSIKTGWDMFSVNIGRAGKFYKGKSYALSGLRRWISILRTTKNKNFKIRIVNGSKVSEMSREDMISWIFKLKIEIFRASEQEDVLFYLDRISKS